VARRLGLALLFVVFALGVTLTGFYLAVTQIHSPRPAALAGVVLIWPYALVNRIFHAILGPAPLSPPVYYVGLMVASVIQLFYVFAIVWLARLVFPATRSHPDSGR
jgi:hypothetical protein